MLKRSTKRKSIKRKSLKRKSIKRRKSYSPVQTIIVGSTIFAGFLGLLYLSMNYDFNKSKEKYNKYDAIIEKDYNKLVQKENKKNFDNFNCDEIKSSESLKTYTSVMVTINNTNPNYENIKKKICYIVYHDQIKPIISNLNHYNLTEFQTQFPNIAIEGYNEDTSSFKDNLITRTYSTILAFIDSSGVIKSLYLITNNFTYNIKTDKFDYKIKLKKIITKYTIVERIKKCLEKNKYFTEKSDKLTSGETNFYIKSINDYFSKKCKQNDTIKFVQTLSSITGETYTIKLEIGYYKNIFCTCDISVKYENKKYYFEIKNITENPDTNFLNST